MSHGSPWPWYSEFEWRTDVACKVTELPPQNNLDYPVDKGSASNQRARYAEVESNVDDYEWCNLTNIFNKHSPYRKPSLGQSLSCNSTINASFLTNHNPIQFSVVILSIELVMFQNSINAIIGLFSRFSGFDSIWIPQSGSMALLLVSLA